MKRSTWLCPRRLAAPFLLIATLLLVSASPDSSTSASIAPARETIAELRREIGRHDALYFVQAAPEISDGDYDELKRQLAELEARHPEAAKAAPPLAQIGDDRTGRFQTHRHREPMMSLEKAYTDVELRAFHTRLMKHLACDNLTYVVEPKFDGLAVSITYEQGRLVRAVTRGNGIEGEDITANVRQITGLPHTLNARAPNGDLIPVPEMIEVRGEIYVPFMAFERVNAEQRAAGERVFSNPRNLAAGTIRQRNSGDVRRRGLQIVFFGVGACEPGSALPPTHQELQQRFAAWGLPAISQVWRARGANELLATIDDMARARAGYQFPTDGAVAKLDSLGLQREAGASETAPRWAVAYKFATERVETRLLAITLQTGRTGVVTPVAELAPVELGGTTVSRATLHNADEIARKDIRVGDFVYVEKAGEIIPAIIGVNRSRRPAGAPPYAFPRDCPDCSHPLVRNDAEVAVRCGNGDCPAQLRRRIEHFASKGCLDIRGLGPSMVDALVSVGLVKDLPDLYRLRRDDIVGAAARAGDKSIEQLIKSIEASKRAELWRFILGLGIPQIGPASARELAVKYGSLEALAAAQASTHRMSISRAEPSDAAVAAYLSESRNRTMLARLAAEGVRPTVTTATGSSAMLAGRTFVLTGTLPSLTRTQATAKIEAAGGKVAGTVTRATNYVVAGAEPGAKLEQARALGVSVIDELELRRILDEPSELTANSEKKPNQAGATANERE
ncbi:MAG: NAD-dependent DNA ligase LigA [Opitutaceae bacterium]|nr:NAD-dependent DNA ligase LigA [Opitutaceae bacterium]